MTIEQIAADSGVSVGRLRHHFPTGPDLALGVVDLLYSRMMALRLRYTDGWNTRQQAQMTWRSFVHEGFSDWAEYQYRTFAPLDGEFAENVVVQTKNGPLDFQVREPVHPLFGAMPRTNQAIELQITQEYTGHNVHLCYLVPQWKEDPYGPHMKIPWVQEWYKTMREKGGWDLE